MYPQRKQEGLTRILSDRTMNVGGGVDDTAVLIDFEMYVRAGRTTCRADQGNVLTFINDITDINQ